MGFLPQLRGHARDPPPSNEVLRVPDGVWWFGAGVTPQGVKGLYDTQASPPPPDSLVDIQITLAVFVYFMYHGQQIQAVMVSDFNQTWVARSVLFASKDYPGFSGLAVETFANGTPPIDANGQFQANVSWGVNSSLNLTMVAASDPSKIIRPGLVLQVSSVSFSYKVVGRTSGPSPGCDLVGWPAGQAAVGEWVPGVGWVALSPTPDCSGPDVQPLTLWLPAAQNGAVGLFEFEAPSQDLQVQLCAVLVDIQGNQYSATANPPACTTVALKSGTGVLTLKLELDMKGGVGGQVVVQQTESVDAPPQPVINLPDWAIAQAPVLGVAVIMMPDLSIPAVPRIVAPAVPLPPQPLVPMNVCWNQGIYVKLPALAADFVLGLPTGVTAGIGEGAGRMQIDLWPYTDSDSRQSGAVSKTYSLVVNGGQQPTIGVYLLNGVWTVVTHGMDDDLPVQLGARVQPAVPLNDVWLWIREVDNVINPVSLVPCFGPDVQVSTTPPPITPPYVPTPAPPTPTPSGGSSWGWLIGIALVVGLVLWLLRR